MLQLNIKSFSYSEKEILKNISFQLKKGEHLAVLGESGCGKSTLLHLIYGLLHLEHGSIFWNKNELLGPTHNLVPGEDFIKLVAQEFNVMPFISVAENIASHLPRLDTQKDAERVSELLKVVDLEDFKDIKVKNLSGGQKQRVALAKALANRPELLLLDEPFSNIDTFRKNKLRRSLFNYLKQHDISCITATHDSEEALAFSDTILMLKNGAVEAYGETEDVYNTINSEYQAGFFGEVNTLPSKLFSSEEIAEELILLPHQLRYSKVETTLQVVVKKSFFKGSYYLIQSLWKEKNIFFNHNEKLKQNTKTYLTKK